MKKHLKFILVALTLLSVLTLSVACNVTIHTDPNNSDDNSNEWADDFDLLGKVLEYVKANYIGDIDIDKLDYITAYTLIRALDDFSYLTDNAVSLTSTASLGLTTKITPYNEYIVDHIFEGFPVAEVKEGGFLLKRGDYIYAVNGERVEGASKDYMNSLIRGEAGTSVTLTIKREGVILGDYTYTKVDKVAPKAYYIGNLDADNPNVGYIKLREFSDSKTAEGELISVNDDFDKCVEQFKNDNKTSLILDLRGNPGGSANVLSHIASYFVPMTMLDGEKSPTDILSLTYEKLGQEVMISVSEDNYMDIPLFILVDENTASAAEALTGACRAYNNKNTTIIGSKTFGKGVFQARSPQIKDHTDTSYIFDDTYYIYLVSGYYYIIDPSYQGGRYCIHENGILPNIEAETTVIGELSNDAEIKKAIELS